MIREDIVLCTDCNSYIRISIPEALKAHEVMCKYWAKDKGLT